MNNRRILTIGGAVLAVILIAVGIFVVTADFGDDQRAEAEDVSTVESPTPDGSTAPSASGGLQDCDSSAADATSRDNKATFTVTGPAGYQVTIAGSDNYAITPSQASTWGGVADAVAGTGSTATLDVTAGRCGSMVPYTFYNDQQYTAEVNFEISNSPDNWNFAFTGCIFLTRNGQTSTYPVVIAQYVDTGLRNTWTVGGVGINWNNDGSSMSSIDDGVTLSATGVDSFDLQVAAPTVQIPEQC